MGKRIPLEHVYRPGQNRGVTPPGASAPQMRAPVPTGQVASKPKPVKASAVHDPVAKVVSTPDAEVRQAVAALARIRAKTLARVRKFRAKQVKA